MKVVNEQLLPKVLYLSFNVNPRITQEVYANLVLGGLDPIIVDAKRIMSLANKVWNVDKNPRVIRCFRELCRRYTPDCIIIPTGYHVSKTQAHPFGKDVTDKLIEFAGVVFMTYESGAIHYVNPESLDEPEFTHWSIKRDGIKGMFSEKDFCTCKEYREARIRQIRYAILEKVSKEARGKSEICADDDACTGEKK